MQDFRRCRYYASSPYRGGLALEALRDLAREHGSLALVHAERAMALSPLDPGFFLYLTVAGLASLFSGRPEYALELAKRSAAVNPDWDRTYWALVATYAQLDRLAEARAALAKLLSLSPGLAVSGARQRLPIRNPASLDMILDGFHKAGLPD